MDSLTGKNAVVFGGSSNIGLAIARRFASEGANVTIVARNEDKLKEAVASIGHGATYAQVDAANDDQVAKFFEPFEQVDLLATCAGSFVFGAIDELPVSEWEELFAPRFFGQIRACHYAVPKMPAGSVIMLCSGIAARAGIVEYAGGAGLCGAVNSMGKAMAMELAPREIRVNVLSPGLIIDRPAHEDLKLDDPVNSLRREFVERIPMGRPGFPEDMAEAAMFLAKCDYATGMVLDVDGGWTTI